MSSSAAAPPLLSVRHASKSYDGEAALIDAGLDLRAGEVHALMGENGAGKSTLIKLLAGVETPDSLVLEIDGQPVELRGPAEAGRLGFRFIHQELNVVPALSVAENIFLGHPYPRTALGTIAWRRLRGEARLALESLGVTHIDPGLPMSRLDTGDAMLASIARAFVEPGRGGEPGSVYVMDEPTAALSRRETELLFAVVRRLRERGAGVLYVSHRIEEIFELADRVTVLRDGRRVSTVDRADATRESLILAMTGRTLAGAASAEAFTTPDEHATYALETHELRTAALHGVSLALRAGEVVGVTGLSGAGRSELLRALIGADRLTGGTIRMAGRAMKLRDPAAAWQAGLAYVPEERRSQALAMNADVRRNVLLPHLARVTRTGLVRRSLERRETERWSRQVGLRARGSWQSVHELSGGNQQKVVLARALAAEPKVLLLDEPTRGVDVGAKADIYALIKGAAAAGAAVLVASSDLDEVLAICDRVLVLHAGRLVFERQAASLDRTALLELCYGGVAA